MIVTRIGPLSAAKIAGTLYAAGGLLVGALFSLVSLIGAATSDSLGNAAFGAVFGIGAVIVFPILYGVLGFVSTLVAASIYNVLAGVVGGIELDVTPRDGGVSAG